MKLGLLKNPFYPVQKILPGSLGAEPLLMKAPLSVVLDGKPIRLDLGKQHLWLFGDVLTRVIPGAAVGDMLLVDPDRYFSGIAGFARIRPGESLVIGRGNEELDRVFGFPKSVKKRHLKLTNEGGEILLEPLDIERDTFVSSVDDPTAIARIWANRQDNLRSVTEIFDGPIELLPPDQAMAAIKGMNELLRDDPYRAQDSQGQPGGLLDLPRDVTPIIVGDLHAQIDNLLSILSANHFLEGLRSGTAALILLGDTVHREEDGMLEEMESSLLMLDLIFKLKIRFPRNVFYLRGNHESFDESVGKAGVPQGQIFRRQVKLLRGSSYAKRLAECFDLLPYVVRSEDFIACHAGPTRRRVSPRELINIRAHPKLAHELTWNRLRRPSYPGGYSKKDVKSFRQQLGVAKHTPFIVSHTPVTSQGAVWTDLAGIKNHHVVFSARPDKVAVMIRDRHEMIPLMYPVEPLRARMANLVPAA